MVGVENLIPDKLLRLQITGQDTLKTLEERKDGGAERENMGRVNYWCALMVNVAIDHLDKHEKVKMLAAAMSEANNSDQAP